MPQVGYSINDVRRLIAEKEGISYHSISWAVVKDPKNKDETISPDMPQAYWFERGAKNAKT